ncbi:MAG: hypothetical protein Q8N85_06290 [Candidatus Omnitrophota bacterium]|nr:hypothetical protein [Candidatus Omnitrophota bacterium]
MITSLLLVTVILLQGCVAFWASQLGYQEARGKYAPLYDGYKLEQEAINLERSKQGLPAEQVLEFKDWLKEQPLNNREIRLFRTFGVISPQEADEMKRQRKRRIK